MQLVSYTFPCFLAVLLLLYYVLPRRMQWGILLLGSFLFYIGSGFWGLCFLLLSIFSTWILSQRMDGVLEESRAYVKAHGLKGKEKRQQEEPAKRRARRCLILGLLLNFGLLAVLKYSNFVLDSFYHLALLFQGGGAALADAGAADTGLLGAGNAAEAGGMAVSQMPFHVDWLLPLGISYYTFQSASYLIDVCRGKARAEKNFFRYALFVSFFPQMVQGPISRHGELAPQLAQAHALDMRQIEAGLFRMLFGYWKKLLLADRLALLVAALAGDPAAYHGVYAWISMFAYTLWMYADFTGGIDIVLGAALLFGIRLPENFNHPFFSHSLAEFWRNWHISLMRWFRDYLFYPLSMSKAAQGLSRFLRKHFGNAIARRAPLYFANLLVWFVTGIWHGASWGFVLWGLSNCIVLLLSQELSPLFQRFRKKHSFTSGRAYHAFEILRTIVIFSMLEMFEYYPASCVLPLWGSLFFSFRLPALASFPSYLFSVPEWALLVLALFLLLASGFASRRWDLAGWLKERPLWLRLLLLYLLFFSILIFGCYGQGYDASQFVYNQF